ncbi:MAG: hypothetical protein ABIR34_01875 [Marmoricola sp.]
MSDLHPPADRSVKIPHLVFGLLFLGVAGIWALVVTDVITEDRLPVLAPAVLIVAGVIGLAASLASTRNRRQKRNQSPLTEGGHVQHETVPDDTDYLQSDPEDHTQEIR